MYISVPALILIIFFLAALSQPNALSEWWDELKCFGSCLGICIALGMGLVGIYLFFVHEFVWALIAISPLMAIGLKQQLEESKEITVKKIIQEKTSFSGQRSMDVLKPDVLLSLIKRQQGLNSKLKDSPQKLKEEREKFADQIKLGHTLYKFYDGIKHYPAWYKDDKNATWCCPSIQKHEIRELNWSKDLYEQCPENEVKEGKKTLILNMDKLNLKVLFFEQENHGYSIEYAKYVGVSIFCGKERVFKGTLKESTDMYTSYLGNFSLEALKPGEWLESLYVLMFNCREYSELKNVMADEERKKEKAEKTKQDFL